MVTFKKVCCCRLPTFGMVIGWLGIVGGLFNIVLYSFFLSKEDEIILGPLWATSMVRDADKESVSAIAEFILSICILLFVIGFIASILLVIGIVKKRHLLLMPWLINAIIGWVIFSIYLIILISGMIYSGSDAVQLVVFILLFGLIYALQTCIIIGIYSLYKQIRDSSEHRVLYDKNNLPYENFANC